MIHLLFAVRSGINERPFELVEDKDANKTVSSSNLEASRVAGPINSLKNNDLHNKYKIFQLKKFCVTKAKTVFIFKKFKDLGEQLSSPVHFLGVFFLQYPREQVEIQCKSTVSSKLLLPQNKMLK